MNGVTRFRKTLRDFNERIIGYIDDVNNELMILSGDWRAILIRDTGSKFRDVTNPPQDIKEKVIRTTIDTLFEMGMLDAAIVPDPDPSPLVEEDIEMVIEQVDKKIEESQKKK